VDCPGDGARMSWCRSRSGPSRATPFVCVGLPDAVQGPMVGSCRSDPTLHADARCRASDAVESLSSRLSSRLDHRLAPQAVPAPRLGAAGHAGFAGRGLEPHEPALPAPPAVLPATRARHLGADRRAWRAGARAARRDRQGLRASLGAGHRGGDGGATAGRSQGRGGGARRPLLDRPGGGRGVRDRLLGRHRRSLVRPRSSPRLGRAAGRRERPPAACFQWGRPLLAAGAPPRVGASAPSPGRGRRGGMDRGPGHGATAARGGSPAGTNPPLLPLPRRPGMGEADAREALADPQPAVWLGCLAFCVRDGALLERFVAAGRDSAEALGRYTGVRYEVAGAAFSLVEGAGPGAVAALILLLDQTLHGKHISLADDRRACAEALALLPDAAAFAALVDRLDVKEVAAAAVAFARRLPRIALAPLAGQVAQGSGGLAAASLLASLAGSEASLVDELLPGLPAASRQAVETARGRGGSGLREATPKELPAVLARPPWSQLTASHKKKAAALAPLALEPLPFEESAVWEDGERERWLDTVPRHSLFGSAVSRFAEKLWKSVPYADRSHNAHPQRWLAQQSAPAVIGVLVEATAALPEEGIGMCLPFRSPRLAPVVARALFRVPRVRAAARRWLSRHAECAAVALIPPAMGPAGKEREEAEAALRELARQGNQEIVTS